MNDFLLKLLGARVEAAGDIASVRLAFQGGAAAGGVVLLAMALGVLAWWTYRLAPSTATPARRTALVVLRVTFLALLALLLLRPVLAFTVEGSVRRALLLLVDGSASMQIQDPRIQPDDLARAALVRGLVDPTKGLGQALPPGRAREVETVARLDLLRSALKNERLDLLPRLDHDFDLVPFEFGAETKALPRARPTGDESGPARKARRKAAVTDFPWVDSLSASSAVTPLGDALRRVVELKRGQPLAGVVVITDGANNTGVSPREIATQLKQEGVPIYLYGVGITSPRDIILASLFAPEVSFVKDEVRVTARIRAQGLEGESAEVVLKLAGQVVDRKPITFGPDGEQVVALNFTPGRTGEFELEAGIEPRADETVKDNNARVQHLRVIDDKIKVLLVEQSPRWEYRYLQAMFLRDRRVEFKTVLFEGAPSIARGDNTPFLERFPVNKEELYQYDLVIFGDVDPRGFTGEQMRNVNEFVARFGGSFLMIAGKRFSPGAWRRTPIDQLLPVEFDAAVPDADPREALAEKPVALQLTSAGRASTMLRLVDQEADNLAVWQKLPPVFWVARVLRSKPGAEVLVVDPDPVKASRFGPMPVVAVQQYGLGQAMFVGTDNTWRWRKNTGDEYHTAFWGQVAQRLALPHMMGGSRRTQLTFDRQNFVTGERITLYARLYRAGFEPEQDPVVKGFYTLRGEPGEAPVEVPLRAVPDQPGVYRGEFIAPAAGLYRFHVESDSDTRVDFNVTPPRFEFGDTAMNEPLLRELAALSGGEFFREENLFQLPERIRLKTDRVRSPLEVELWASPFYYLLLLGLVTVEWILRKLVHLK